MAKTETGLPEIDWNVTTFEGSRREQLRRWSQLPLEDILRALEEMHYISQRLSRPGDPDSDSPAGVADE